MCHLLGSSRIINSIEQLGVNGGLGEAAAWLVLRQHIYVSLMSNASLDISLGCYKVSLAVQGSTDHDWANKILLICAHCLAYQSKPSFPGELPTDGNWNTLRCETINWYQSKPDTFLPLFENHGGVQNSTQQTHKAFPEIAMLHAPHVMAMMYYHLAMIILTLSDPSHLHRAGLLGLRSWKEIENRIRPHLKKCIGLALSNPHVPAAKLEASHILYACGLCLDSPIEQDMAVTFLRDVRKKLAWKTEHIVSHLNNLWKRR